MTDHGEREDLGRSVDATGLGCAARAGAAPRDERVLAICRAVWPIFHPGAKYDGWSHWPNGRDLLDAVERALSPAPVASGGGETLKFLAAVIAGICTYGHLDAHDREALTKALARHKAASSGAPAASGEPSEKAIRDALAWSVGEQARHEEREACAEVVEALASQRIPGCISHGRLLEAVAAIRARAEPRP